MSSEPTDERHPPIGDYALLSDCRSWALVSRHGDVDWCNFHEAESHPVLSRILDRRHGGRCSLRPVADGASATVSRRYLDDTNVLETTFRTTTGTLVVTDAMVVDQRSDPHRAVAVVPHNQLVRQARCVDGEVEVDLDLAPRFDYGLTRPRVQVTQPRRALVFGGGDAAIVDAGVDLQERGRHACGARTVMRAGDEWCVGLRHLLPHHLDEEALRPAADLRDRLRTTVDFWREWLRRCTYRGPYREHVLRSALVLKGLTDAQTGAIVAAPTTSLPEDIGGERNWDYRYTWIRDAAMLLEALFGLGYRDEAVSFFAYVERTTAGTADDLRVLYGSRGQRLVPEVEIQGIEGYRGSRPVRIGNAAADQFQLDAWGHLLNAAWHHREHGGALDEELCHLLRECVDVVLQRWKDPDQGLWEIRSEPRRFVSSQLYAWVALDRAVRLADDLHLDAVDRVRDTAERIRTGILEQGTDPTSGAFVQAFDNREADASNLLIPLEGVVAADDERVTATIELLREELAEHGGVLLHRYRTEDGLWGAEGAFVLCSFWLAAVLAARDEVAEARRVFEGTVAHANDLGLLAEQVDAEDGGMLGNFPLAISHAGLVDAALQIEAAEARRAATEHESDQGFPWAAGHFNGGGPGGER